MRYMFVDPNVQELIIANNLPADVGFWWQISDDANINQLYVNKDGGVSEYPPKPFASAVFDLESETWYDPRTAEQLTQELQNRRAQAFLPKLEFIMRTVAKGYISKASGLTLLAGQIPQELIGLPDLLNEEQVFELQAKLIAASQVDRLDPFIQVVAWYMGLTDADVDLLFDVETPAPIA